MLDIGSVVIMAGPPESVEANMPLDFAGDLQSLWIRISVLHVRNRGNCLLSGVGSQTF